MSALGIQGAYNGVIQRAIFNIPYGGALYTTATHDENAWVWWLATFAAYPLHALKSISQVSGNAALSRNLYKGIIPFALVNYFCVWKMLGLFPREKLEKLEADIRKKA